MTIQRKRNGQRVTILPEKRVQDARGEWVTVPDRENGHPTKAVLIPEQSSIAEVPGQVDIDTYLMIVHHRIPKFGTWSRVLWDDREWDLAEPPKYQHGTRHTRHVFAVIRARPHRSAVANG